MKAMGIDVSSTKANFISDQSTGRCVLLRDLVSAFNLELQLSQTLLNFQLLIPNSQNQHKLSATVTHHARFKVDSCSIFLPFFKGILVVEELLGFCVVMNGFGFD